jgi:hypothetical protein
MEENIMNLDVLKSLTYSLVIIGALNWGMIGLFDFNLVSALFGDMSFLSRTVYNLVGLSAIVSLFMEFYVCKRHTKCRI